MADKKTETKAKRVKIDWEAVERDYRIGQLTIRQIQEKHKVSNGGMMERVKKESWTRDLSESVRLATKAKVRAKVVQQVREQVARTGAETGAKAERSTFQEVDLASNVNATIILRHQRQADEFASLLGTMGEEIKALTVATPESIELLVMAIVEGDPDAAKKIEQLRTLSSRLGNLKTASEVLGLLSKIERTAFNIDDARPADDDRTRKLRAIVAASEGAE